MATLETILNIETEVESVLDAFLSGSPYSLSAGGTDTATRLTTPRTEIKCEVVKSGPHQYNITSGTYNGTNIFDQFQLRVRVDVVYQPEQGQGPGGIRGTVRKALANWTGIKAGFASNAYLLLAQDTLRQIDGGRTINDEDKTETLSTVYEVVAFLNPVALNAAT